MVLSLFCSYTFVQFWDDFQLRSEEEVHLLSLEMDAASHSYIPIKQAALAIQKFNEVGIPHHLGLLKNHKSNIEKCLALGDWDKMKKEEINATRVVKQLKNLILDMDMLRSKVIESDLDQFDELTLPGRQKAKESIREYLGNFLSHSLRFFPTLSLRHFVAAKQIYS